MITAVATTCPYCGVGCGLIADANTVLGDPSHPANRGRLCVKGAALARTLDDSRRLTEPHISGRPARWDDALDLIARQFSETIAAYGSDSVAFYVSGQFLTEDYYVANKLMKGFIGSGNIDTNSRLCMASSVAGSVRAFGEDVVPGVYDDFDHAELVVLVGSNASWCHPVLYQRLMTARAARQTRVVVVDPRRSATAEAADLHLPIACGTDVALFNGLLAYLADAGSIDTAWTSRHTVGLDAAIFSARADAPDIETVATKCGIDPEALETFYAWFAQTECVVTAFSQGVNQAIDGTNRVNAIINCHLATARIGRPGMGPFSLTGQPNAMGGREVGGLADQLAAHLRFDQPDDIEALRNFWNAPRLATQPGLQAVDLFDAVMDDRVKALWIAATNPAASMPRAEQIRAALRRCPFVVVSDCWPTDTTALAHVVLPAAGWGEKDGTVTNSERRITRQRAFRAAPGSARPDWWMFRQVAQRMGWPEAFHWETPAEVFREHAALSAYANHGRRIFDIGALTDADYDSLKPIRWPLPRGASGEGGRLFATGGFPTPDRRARLVPVRYRQIARPQHVLNTGRVRDQWHTMTRTGHVAQLAAHTPEPMVAINPLDAATLGVEAGGLARISSEHGAVLLRVVPTHTQRRGEIFAPMHWTREFTSTGPIGRIVDADCDPVSGQPALKSTPVRIVPVATQFAGLLLRHGQAAPPVGVHWVRIPLERGEMFRLTGLDRMPTGVALNRFASALLQVSHADIIEMVDTSRGVLRRAALRDGVLEACLVLARSGIGLPNEAEFAASLGAVVPLHARARLLSSRGSNVSEGPRLCACLGISEAAVRHACVSNRLNSLRELSALLGVGTSCGSCIPELEKILRDVRVPAR
jgi:assimilatory nitrate reductase catalytic subunit